jgi:hypothetical protein
MGSWRQIKASRAAAEQEQAQFETEQAGKAEDRALRREASEEGSRQRQLDRESREKIAAAGEAGKSARAGKSSAGGGKATAFERDVAAMVRYSDGKMSELDAAQWLKTAASARNADPNELRDKIYMSMLTANGGNAERAFQQTQRAMQLLSAQPEQQAQMLVEDKDKGFDWWGLGDLFGGASAPGETATAATPQKPPADRAHLKIGDVYLMPDGARAKWTGAQFEAVE